MRQSWQLPAIRWIDVAATASFARRRVIRLIAPATVRLIAPATVPLDLAPAAASFQRRQMRTPVTLIWRPKDGAAAAQHAAASAPARAAATRTAPAMTQSAFEPAPMTTVMRSNAVVSSSSSAAAPDFNRLVDEVMRRIDRHTRSERQRRGL
jgi:hypothetical protein